MIIRNNKGTVWLGPSPGLQRIGSIGQTQMRTTSQVLLEAPDLFLHGSWSLGREYKQPGSFLFSCLFQ
ncbi:hypothetical protein D3C73_577130 [compost metagenome]